MWYRIICLSHLMFIIMVLIWCPMSIRIFVHSCFCCAQVYARDFAWHFFILSIYWKEETPPCHAYCIHIITYTLYKEEKNGTAATIVLQKCSVYFFLCCCCWVTCYINDKLKTFVMFINMCVCVWVHERQYENTQQFVCVWVCHWNATMKNIFTARNQMFPFAIVQVNHWLDGISPIEIF